MSLLLQLALPYCQETPPEFLECDAVPLIGNDIPIYLAFPVFGIGLWEPVPSHAVVPVPEAAVYLHNGFVLRKHEVGLSWQRRIVQSVPEAASEQPLSDD